VHLDLRLVVLERSGLRLAHPVEGVQASWGSDDSLHALTVGLLDEAIHHDGRKVAADVDDTLLDSILEVGAESVLVIAVAELLECLADERECGINIIDFASRELDQELGSNDTSETDSLRIAWVLDTNVAGLGDPEDARVLQVGEEPPEVIVGLVSDILKEWTV